jgi:hypothetical protein
MDAGPKEKRKKKRGSVNCITPLTSEWSAQKHHFDS